MIDLDFLFAPVEHLDESLAGLFEGAPLAVALGVAFLLGLRHATDPDHLMAVTSLVARDGARHPLGGAPRRGVGRRPRDRAAAHRPAADPARHGAPACARERRAEKAVGVVIILLRACRVLRPLGAAATARATHHDARPPAHARARRSGSALLHGLAGTGAVVLLLIAALPNPLEASRRAGRVRADVGRLDGALHVGLRVDAHAARRRCPSTAPC